MKLVKINILELASILFATITILLVAWGIMGTLLNMGSIACVIILTGTAILTKVGNTTRRIGLFEIEYFGFGRYVIKDGDDGYVIPSNVNISELNELSLINLLKQLKLRETKKADVVIGKYYLRESKNRTPAYYIIYNEVDELVTMILKDQLPATISESEFEILVEHQKKEIQKRKKQAGLIKF